MASAGEPAGEPRYERGTIIPTPRGPSQKAPRAFKTRGTRRTLAAKGLMSTAFAHFSPLSAFLHRRERLRHPCSRSEDSSTNSSSYYRAQTPDAHPEATDQNPSTGCRDPDHTATIHPPCAAKRHFPHSDTCLGSRDHPASNRPACAANIIQAFRNQETLMTLAGDPPSRDHNSLQEQKSAVRTISSSSSSSSSSSI